MNRMKWLAALFAAFFFGTPALADASSCQSSPTVQAFHLDSAKIKRQASFINLWWNSAEAQSLSFEERKAQRIKDIDDFFGTIESARRDAYSRASCLVVATKKCASTPGKKHVCPMSFSPPANMRFVPATLQAIDDDFEVWPHYAGGSINFANKKTGKGSNTDGFQVLAEYTPEHVDARVKQDLDQVHAIVDALFNEVALVG